jgi:hypothetical protein
MSVIITNGQSWDQIAADFTLSPDYGPAIAIQNNMQDQSITGKKFRIEIPDNWMKPDYAGKQISLPAPSSGASIIPGVPNWAIMAAGVALVFLALK